MLTQLTDLIGRANFNQSSAEFISILILLVCIGIISWLANILCKMFIHSLLSRIEIKYQTPWFISLRRNHSFRKLSHIVPGVIIYKMIPLTLSGIYGWTGDLVNFIQDLSLIYIVLTFVWFLLSVSNATVDWYKSISDTSSKPILAYIQAAKIFVWGFGIIMIISIVIQKSPLALLAGLGAASAVLMLVFRDTIIGFVANIQVSVYDMARQGDWVTIPSYGADGTIVELSVNTTKIQNFDKTIVTVPTSALISNGVQNWRGMFESGGRRIKRSINIDIDTIKFCDQDLLSRLKGLNYLESYIDQAEKEISEYNTKSSVNTDVIANGRQLTNVGLFRRYISNYLSNHLEINHDMLFLVRQLQSTSTGLPLELYIFTKNTSWVVYEGVQADIFDHIFAAMPLFDLKTFQVFSSQSKISK
ncbi:mechanosensitive ion channel family protein [Francisellaceae bacterium]|nr:mechanosensitive ion channel family protein [Francisellaceae bacterium]